MSYNFYGRKEYFNLFNQYKDYFTKEDQIILKQKITNMEKELIIVNDTKGITESFVLHTDYFKAIVSVINGEVKNVVVSDFKTNIQKYYNPKIVYKSKPFIKHLPKENNGKQWFQGDTSINQEISIDSVLDIKLEEFNKLKNQCIDLEIKKLGATYLTDQEMYDLGIVSGFSMIILEDKDVLVVEKYKEQRNEKIRRYINTAYEKH